MTGIAGAADHLAPVRLRTCHACGAEMPDTAGFAARALPGHGVVLACSRTCAEDARFRLGFRAEVAS